MYDLVTVLCLIAIVVWVADQTLRDVLHIPAELAPAASLAHAARSYGRRVGARRLRRAPSRRQPAARVQHRAFHLKVASVIRTGVTRRGAHGFTFVRR
jgi:hypothetical protein